MRTLVTIAALVVVAAAAPSSSQESLTWRPPARDFTVNISGERTAYLPDGGCTCQAESSVPAPPVSCNGTCAASRLRSRVAVGIAIDGGALEQR